ncbi:MAG: glycoside hydrolase family 108 protein [Sphingopyxis solisilvae]|uniref:glycoside hydrolase family 108 protein n=1 Tax=Sphingopyxis solisilvae TaxID=1886788 RepID=UPI004035E0DB
MTDVSKLIDAVIDREGAYVNHPADRGGPTCWGITQAVARAHGYQGDMRNLPRSQAREIYRKIYWLKPGFDKIATRAPIVAAEMFDTGINMGVGTAAGFLQRALNALNRLARDYPDVAVDRAVGPRTLAALDGYLKARGRGGEGVLLKALEALQGERYIALAEKNPSQEAFVYGWLAHRIGNEG